jgi:hypothetical protein
VGGGGEGGGGSIFIGGPAGRGDSVVIPDWPELA